MRSPILMWGTPYDSDSFYAKCVLPEAGGPVINTLSGKSPLKRLNSWFKIGIDSGQIPLEQCQSKAPERKALETCIFKSSVKNSIQF